MRIIPTRREFVAAASTLGAATLFGVGPSLANEQPPETTTIRLYKNSNICLAPMLIADELLRAEGFTEISYVETFASDLTFPEAVAQGEVNFGIAFVASLLKSMDDGVPIRAIGGVHTGCYELFAHDSVQNIRDLKGKRVGIQTLGSEGYLYVAIMANNVGLDPRKDIEWITDVNAMELFADHKVDAFLSFPPEPQELRARKAGRAILKTATDRPWSQYLCCLAFTSSDFAESYPVATKRALRAFLKTADFCATDPAGAAQRLVDGQFTDKYEFSKQALSEIPYTAWRDYDVEDTFRFYALQLREAGIIKSNPNDLIAAGADWGLFEELKRELKS
jgi:NitT/TauT family transport system substrate-binding protein